LQQPNDAADGGENQNVEQHDGKRKRDFGFLNVVFKFFRHFYFSFFRSLTESIFRFEGFFGFTAATDEFSLPLINATPPGKNAQTIQKNFRKISEQNKDFGESYAE
jgi:hypothetical protein